PFSTILWILLWILYLSLVKAGQIFLSFQWDILLLEAGFLVIFLMPFRIFPRRYLTSAPSAIVTWL
ncbi:MAG: lipase maturation factor family protein, partial [Calditrichae bacterium]|nr:lipase maturation factor family protein [Calditrichia bacterium]